MEMRKIVSCSLPYHPCGSPLSILRASVSASPLLKEKPCSANLQEKEGKRKRGRRGEKEGE